MSVNWGRAAADSYTDYGSWFGRTFDGREAEASGEGITRMWSGERPYYPSDVSRYHCGITGQVALVHNKPGLWAAVGVHGESPECVLV